MNTLIYAVLTSGAKTALGLLLAVLLTTGILFQGTIRTVIFFPVLVSTIGVGIAFGAMMHPTKGVINLALALVGIDGPGWLVNPAPFSCWRSRIGPCLGGKLRGSGSSPEQHGIGGMFRAKPKGPARWPGLCTLSVAGQCIRASTSLIESSIRASPSLAVRLFAITSPAAATATETARSRTSRTAAASAEAI